MAEAPKCNRFNLQHRSLFWKSLGLNALVLISLQSAGSTYVDLNLHLKLFLSSSCCYSFMISDWRVDCVSGTSRHQFNIMILTF